MSALRPAKLRSILVSMILLFLLSLLSFASTTQCQAVDKAEPLRVYLLTSGPGLAQYSRIGHSALWTSGAGRKETIFNWGAYDDSEDYFLLRFFLGTAKYRLTLMSNKRNLRRIENEQQKLVAQRLSLPPHMKRRLVSELAHLSKPENKSYVYHWVKQNCATLIRDVLDTSTYGSFQHLKGKSRSETYRQEVLRHLGGLYWAWFGWHYMASHKGDETYDAWDQLHIPYRLMEAVGSATIQWPDGSIKPLVDQTCELKEGQGWAPAEPPNRVVALWTIGLTLCLLFWRGLYSSKRPLRKVSSHLLMVYALFVGGLSTTFMTFAAVSELEGYGPNENWFYSSPLTLALVWVGLHASNKSIRGRLIVTALFGISVLGVLFEVVGFSIQENSDFIGLMGLPTLGVWLAQRK